MEPGGDLEMIRDLSREHTHILLRTNDLEKALEINDRIFKYNVERRTLETQRETLWFKGLVQVQKKSLNEAEKTAGELKEAVEKGLNKKSIRLYHHLSGLVELENGNFSAAIEDLNKARRLLPSQSPIGKHEQALFLYPLALAYFKAGDLKAAAKEFGAVTALTTGRFMFGDLYARSFYMLGKIAEEQGNRKRAVGHYAKFLDLWKNADPGLPEVEDAKARLAALR